ncbi:MAG: hypothetical protein ACSLFJ_14995 [Immundisolibacter sp.]|uniref:hypothetical protein n=1 Tax=Immundisolibacter sp. TaxID=1934948 RepID=UPI003EE101A3
MNLPEASLEDLARLRMYECQGTLLGGLKVAQGLGIDAEEYGYRMMMEQGIGWAKLCGDLEKIARIFHEHYQVSYGFGTALAVTLDDATLSFDMPSLSHAATGQLTHWRLPAQVLEDVNRGFWRALIENAGVTVDMEFSADRHRVTVRRG